MGDFSRSGEYSVDGQWYTVVTHKDRGRALQAATWQRKGSNAPVRVVSRGRGKGYDVQVKRG